MIIPGPPIALPGTGAPVTVPYPGGGSTPQGSHQWTLLKLENASPFLLTIYLDGAATHSLPAGVADVFPLTRSTGGLYTSPAPVVTLAITQTSATTGLSGTVRPSFGQYGDQFPGVYPVALPISPFGTAQPLASLAVSSTGATITLPSWAASMGLIFNNAASNVLTTGGLTVVGTTTGVQYFSSGGIAQNVYVSPFLFDVAPAIDPQVTISAPSGFLIPLYVVAYSTLSRINTPSDPISIAPTDPMPKKVYTYANIGCPSGGVVTNLIAAPPAGFCWEIKLLLLNCGTTALSLSQNFYIRAMPVGAIIIGAYASASGIFIQQAYTDYYSTDQWQAYNSTSVNGVATVGYRQVPLASGL